MLSLIIRYQFEIAALSSSHSGHEQQQRKQNDTATDDDGSEPPSFKPLFPWDTAVLFQAKGYRLSSANSKRQLFSGPWELYKACSMATKGFRGESLLDIPKLGRTGEKHV